MISVRPGLGRGLPCALACHPSRPYLGKGHTLPHVPKGGSAEAAARRAEAGRARLRAGHGRATGGPRAGHGQVTGESRAGHGRVTGRSGPGGGWRDVGTC